MYRNRTRPITNYDSSSILMIGNEGVYRLFCPFKAICISPVASYSLKQIVVITAVKTNPEFKLIYIIQGRAFYHSSFMVISLPDRSQKAIFCFMSNSP